MPKIELSFDEFLDIVSVLDIWANEIKEADLDEATKLKRLNADLHWRYARASVIENIGKFYMQNNHPVLIDKESVYSDTDSVRLHPDAQLPDSIYAPDPEDFKEVP